MNMLKRVLLLCLFTLFLISLPGITYGAERQPNGPCEKGDTCKKALSGGTFVCKPDFNTDGTPKFDANLKTRLYACLPASSVEKVFGAIDPPEIIAQFLKSDSTGASAISQFLSNFIALLFSIAAIVLIFMIIWGALDWTTSGGDKEKLAGAQKRIVHAIIGMILFAVAFAGLAILGRFTGFTLFKGQNYLKTSTFDGKIYEVLCKDGKWYRTNGKDPDEVCRNK